VGYKIRLRKHAMERMSLRAINLSGLELALTDDPSYRDKTGAEIYVKKLRIILLL
jgi:hypothetical protein